MERKFYMGIVLILLGIATDIIAYNNWFMIPGYVAYILYGGGCFLLLIKGVTFIIAKRQINNMKRRNRRW